MPYAVELFFDPDADARVRQIWSTLSQAGICDYLAGSPSRPHVSLSVFDYDDEFALIEFVRSWAAPRTRFAIDAAKTLLISPDGRDGSATIHQDAAIYRLRLEAGKTITHDLQPGRGAWLQVAEGALTFNGTELIIGDGASTEEPGRLTFTATRPVEALLFDLQ